MSGTCYAQMNGDGDHVNGFKRPLTNQCKNKATVVLGTQWGDEGKGKIIDLLATKADIVCRAQGGNNAGHTVVVNDQKYYFHLLPSGLINPKCKAVIGNGCVVHVPSLFKEVESNEEKGLTWWRENLIVSERAHLVFDFHHAVDGMQEAQKGTKKLGTTKKGIGPTYSTKAARHGIRIGELMGNREYFAEKYRQLAMMFQKQFPDLEIDIESELLRYDELREKLRPLVKDAVLFMHEVTQSQEEKNILVEGANATMLDIDFGTYPFVTSSNCSVGGICTGLGLPPSSIGNVVGVVKAYTSRVGAGPFPTEQCNEIGDTLQEVGKEFGVTTGRRRRCGWLDLVMVKYAHVINNLSSIALTKLDILDNFEELKIGIAYTHKGEKLPQFPATLEVLRDVEVEYLTLPGWKQSTVSCRTFEELPYNAQCYVNKIQEILQVPIQWIGVGQSRDSIIQVY
uniref:adenylosuccinate synthetase-like n=1 Tax=Styela clava TaxID=7725 RepID=UPI00193A113B|nr:adenylosuccinate synthetase-like [Styela clava]